jgi:hypothetical protein
MATELPDSLFLEHPLRLFAQATSTQDQRHIRPMHAHVAMRLVIEGGFYPEDLTPHPPLRSRKVRGGIHALEFDPEAETTKERTIIGGLKGKRVDVVACKEGIGPVLCVSLKGTGNAFRNLTNRMEEAIGDCTNVHIMYPGLVYGFMHLLKANREGQAGIGRNDVCVQPDGKVVSSVQRYHDLLCELAGRRFVRNDFTRYEAVAVLLVESGAENAGAIFAGYPPPGSPLQPAHFFRTLYSTYDLRYPYVGATVKRAERTAWDERSPAFEAIREATGVELEEALGYAPRRG